MVRLLPTRSATFGDASVTAGPNRRYVLAQLDGSVDLSWVVELRHALKVAELKYENVQRAHWLREKRELWKRVESGIENSTIIVVDADVEAHGAFVQLAEERGLFGWDFDDADLAQHAQLNMIARSPLSDLPRHVLEMQLRMGARFVSRIDNAGFSPVDIQQQIGRGWRSAAAFSARSYAMCDVDSLWDDASTFASRDMYLSPVAPIIIYDALSTVRCFDDEAPRTLPALNRASSLLAESLDYVFPCLPMSSLPLACEADSQISDCLQGADVAAGLAREAVGLLGTKALSNKFGRVCINGRLLRA